MIVLVPVVVTVSVTEQVLDAPVPADRVQVVGLKLLPLDAVHETVPVGALVVPALVSVTVAVHALEFPIPIPTGLGKQLMVVLVARLLTLKVLLVAPVKPELDAVRV